MHAESERALTGFSILVVGRRVRELDVFPGWSSRDRTFFQGESVLTGGRTLRRCCSRFGFVVGWRPSRTQTRCCSRSRRLNSISHCWNLQRSLHKTHFVIEFRCNRLLFER